MTAYKDQKEALLTIVDQAIEAVSQPLPCGPLFP